MSRDSFGKAVIRTFDCDHRWLGWFTALVANSARDQRALVAAAAGKAVLGSPHLGGFVRALAIVIGRDPAK